MTAAARQIGGMLGRAVREAELAGRMAHSERAIDRTTRHALMSDGTRYTAAVRRSVCGTLTCTYRSVQLVRGIPLCGPCGDALTADITNESDDA